MSKLLVIVGLVIVTIAEPIPNVSLATCFPEHRIIGGENITIDKVPHQVSIAFKGAHRCGGNIIDENWILTAAHCATKAIEDYTVRAGSSRHDIGGSIHTVSVIEYHEEYYTDEDSIPHNDIALFRLSPPIKMDETRQPIELFHTNEEVKVGECSVITGWGIIKFDKTSVKPKFLLMISIPIISKADCRKAYQNYANISDEQICASDPMGTKDACLGDSGGPLVIDKRLAGIVSWGAGCASGYPGVYTEVAYFNKWIAEVTKVWKLSSMAPPSPTLTFGTMALITISFIVLTI